MSRKTYIELARVIREHTPRADLVRGDILLGSIAYALVEVCEQDNPRFDRERFLIACGLEESS